jgi:magnesium transporter
MAEAVPSPQSVAHYLVTDVPTAGPQDRAGSVRELLTGRRYGVASHIFVLDSAGRLAGVVEIGELMAASAGAPLAELMRQPNCHAVRPDTDRELAASMAIRAEVSALAVVGEDGRFVGAVPASALMTILRDEHLEDLHHLVGILSKSEAARAALEASPLRRALFRLPWLLIGLAGSAIITAIMAQFEAPLSSHIAVAFFIPALVFLTDSAGTQSETIAVRSFSLSETSLFALLAAEVGTAIVVGLVLSALALPLIWVFFGDVKLGLAVAVSLFFATAVATAVGVLLPWIFNRLGFDPALSSGPIATAFQDGATLLIYLATATALLS